MSTYRVQDGCHNCRYVFIRTEFDNGTDYFCTYNAPKRPLCMSIQLNESPNFSTIEEFEEYSKKWNKWANGRDVHPCGICEKHEKEG